jgi:hypothetical protein
MITSTVAKKALDKTRYPVIKNPPQVGTGGTYRNMIRDIYEKPIVNIHNSEKPSGTKQQCPLSPARLCSTGSSCHSEKQRDNLWNG